MIALPDFYLAWEKIGWLFWEWIRNDEIVIGDKLLDAIDRSYFGKDRP